MARRIVDIATDDGVYKSTTFPQSVLDSMRTNIYVGDRPEIAGSNIIQLGSIIGSQSIPTKTVTSQNEKITFVNENSGSSGSCYITVNNTTWYVFYASYSSAPVAYFAFVIDDENQLGWVISVHQYQRYGNTNYYIYYQMGNSACYNAILGNEPALYQWSSVPSISGKNGILSLPTLIDTDGNPISGQSASVFSSLPEGSNVRALINGAL